MGLSQEFTVSALCLVVLLTTDCRRPAPTPSPASDPAASPQVLPSPELDTPTMALVENNEQKQTQSDSPTQGYLQSTTMEEKMDAVAQISDLPSAEAVTALAQLFGSEQNVELRCELLGAIIGIEENAPAKLEALTAALSPAQPVSVRQIAIAGLQTLEAREAKELLQRMVYDSDPVIQSAAKEALEAEP